MSQYPLPLMDRHAPLFGNVLHGQINSFLYCFIPRKDSLTHGILYPYQLSVFNAFGEKVFHKSGKGSFDEMIDLNRQEPGLYMVVIESQGQCEVKRLLVRK